jgi:hypothetical protein
MKELITSMIQAAVDGESSCCEVHAELKAIETIIKSGIKLIKSGAVSEAREFDKGERYYGGTWQIRSSATLLHYDNDEPYKEYSELASNRKKLLNSAWKQKNEGLGFFVSEDGEEIPVLKVKTPGTESAIFKATEPKGKENDGKTGLVF